MYFLQNTLKVYLYSSIFSSIAPGFLFLFKDFSCRRKSDIGKKELQKWWEGKQ